jgi:hypothetical protein
MMQRSSQSFLARLVKPSETVRQFSTAASIQARFEKAYLERTAAIANKPVKK